MAYAEKHIITLNDTAITLASTGVKTRWTPGIQGCSVRRFGLMLEAATSATGAVVVLKDRPTPGSAASEVVIQSLTLDAVTAQGTVVYGNDLQYKLLPGHEVVVEVLTAATGGASTHAFLEIDPDWEVPGNLPANCVNKTTP